MISQNLKGLNKDEKEEIRIIFCAKMNEVNYELEKVKDLWMMNV